MNLKLEYLRLFLLLEHYFVALVVYIFLNQRKCVILSECYQFLEPSFISFIKFVKTILIKGAFMSFSDWTFIVMIVLIGVNLLTSPYTDEGSPLSLLLTTIIIVLAAISLIGGVLEHFQEDIQNEQNNQEVVNSDSLKCEPSENGDWICKKIKPVATFDANSKLFIKDSSKKEVNNSSEEQHVILKEKPLTKDNSISLKCTVADDGSYLCKK